MMKKRILIPTLVLALTLALAACGDDEPVETTGETTPDSASETTVDATEPDESEEPGPDTSVIETDPPNVDTPAPDTDPPSPPDTDPPTPPDTDPPPPDTNPPETDPPAQDDDGDTSDFKSNAADESDFATSTFASMFAYTDAAANANSRIENGRYIIEGFTQSIIFPDGKYAFTAENLNSTNKNGASMFIRGVQAFNFGDGGYFGTDQNSFSCGCGGIYITAETAGEAAKLNIVFRGYNGTDNKAILSSYSIKVPSTTITVADKGDMIYILSGDELAATIAVSGTRDFNYSGVGAEECAETVVLTLAGQEAVTIENAVVAASYLSEAGFCTRMTCGAVSFSGVSFGSVYNVDIPEDFMNVEEEVTDPNALVHIIQGDALLAPSGTTSCTTVAGDGFVTITPAVGNNDPCYLLPAGFYGSRYVSVKYRTTTAGGCNTQIYVGSTGANPTNDNTMLQLPLIGDGEWHILVFDLDTLIEKLDSEYYISYMRLDPLQAGFQTDENGDYIYIGDPSKGNIAKLDIPEGATIDIAYVAFFRSEEAANIYEYYTFDDAGNIGQKNSSFDTFYVNNNMYFPEDGGAGQKLNEINNTITFAAGAEHSTMSLRGWIGFDQEIASFGYYIDSPATVIWDDYKQNTGADVLAAGGQYASRFQINADISALEPGSHTVGYVVKLADGKQAILHTEITVIIESADAALSLNKTEYAFGEEIFVTAKGENDGQWVGLYSINDNYEGGAVASLYWYYINDGAHISGETYAINKASNNANADRADLTYLPAGEYKIILFADGGYTAVEQVNFTILPAETSLTSTKTEYQLGEPIIINALTMGHVDWVAVYPAGAALDVNYIGYYYPIGGIVTSPLWNTRNGVDVDVNEMLAAMNTPAGPLGVGSYDICLMENNDYVLIKKITITITEKQAGAPTLVENWNSVNAAPFMGWGVCTSDGNGNLKLNCDGTNIVCAYGIDGAMMNASSAAVKGFENIVFSIDTTTSAADILFIFQPENGAGNNLTTGNVGKAILIKEDGSVEEIAAITTADPRTGYPIPKGTKGTLILPYTTISTYDNLDAPAFASADEATLTRLGFMILPLSGQAGGEVIVGDVYTYDSIESLLPAAPTDPLAKADSIILPDGMLGKPADYAPAQTNKNLFANTAMGDIVTKNTEGDVEFTHYPIANGTETPRILFKRKYSGFAGTQYMLIKYRTNIAQKGVFFIGYDAGDGEGAVPSFDVTWDADGEWSYFAIDLSTISGIAFDENGKISVASLCLINGPVTAECYFDVQYIAFFTSAEDMAAAQQ